MRALALALALIFGSFAVGCAQSEPECFDHTDCVCGVCTNGTCEACPVDAGVPTDAGDSGPPADATSIDADATSSDADATTNADANDAEAMDVDQLDAGDATATDALLDGGPDAQGDADPADVEPTDADASADTGDADADATDAGEGSDGSIDGGGSDAGAADSGLCPANGNWTTLELPMVVNDFDGRYQTAAALSGDGRYVAFTIPDYARLYYPFPGALIDLNTYTAAVFRYDLRTGEQIAAFQGPGGSLAGVSLTYDGTVVPFGNILSRISDDGLVRVQVSTNAMNASIVVASQPNVPVCRQGTVPFGACNGTAQAVRASADGRYVVYFSTATDASFLDFDAALDAYVYDRINETTAIVTADPITGFALNQSVAEDLLDISADGNLVYYVAGGVEMVWDRGLGTRAPGAPPLWRQACGSMQLDQCTASRDGATRMRYPIGAFSLGLIGPVTVERALGPTPMIACWPRSTNLGTFYFQSRPPPPIDVPQYAPVWTGSEMLNWGRVASAAPGTMGLVRYAPDSQAWQVGATLGQPAFRVGYSGTWLGDRYLIWGGQDGGGALQSGYAYSPSTDGWAPISNTAAPSSRANHGAVWTGQYLVVFGGFPLGGDLGGRYDPALDTWSSMNSVGAPTPLQPLANGRGPQLAWNGSEVLVWTGSEIGRYDPAADAWLPVTTAVPHVATYPERTFADWASNRFWIVAADGAFEAYDPTTQDLYQAPAPLISLLGDISDVGFSTGSEVIVAGDPSLAHRTIVQGPTTYIAGEAVLWAPDAETPLWTGTELLMRGGAWASPP